MNETLQTPLARELRAPGAPGFQLRKAFAEPSLGDGMLADVVDIARRAARGEGVEGALVQREGQGLEGAQPEDLVAKIFRLHRRPVFRTFLDDPRITRILVDAIGPDVDCFLSQFIFKNPGAWGQPWHQDSFYFPFEPARPVVALWLAVSEATLANGCLHVLPGSQMEPVHEHVPDRRPGANVGYVEIVDHDMSASQPCLLDPGDLLIFDSHLMHRSTDNVSNGIRAAMVFHFACAGTRDPGVPDGKGGWIDNPVNDWMPLLREGMCST